MEDKKYEIKKTLKNSLEDILDIREKKYKNRILGRNRNKENNKNKLSRISKNRK